MLTVALPKGRIAEQTLEIFAEIFGGEFKFEGRELILDMGEFRFLNVRNQDVPTYVEHGAADIGVVGLDVITEKELDIIQLLDMQLGKCKVAIGIKNEDELDWSRPNIKVATKMVNITQNYFAKKAVGVEVVKLYGSIELAPLVGLADAIVDIPAFQEKGVFNRKVYMTFLNSRGMKAKSFEAILKDDLKIEKLMRMLNKGSVPFETDIISSAFGVKDRIDYQVLTVSDLNVSTGGKEREIRIYWEKNRDRYRTKRIYRLSILWTDLSDLNASMADLREFYRKNSFNYTDAGGKELDFEKARSSVERDYRIKKGKKKALLDYIALKKGRKKVSETVDLPENDPLLSQEVWQKIKQNAAGDIIKPKPVGGRYATVMIEKVIPSREMSYREARTEVESDWLEMSKKKALEKAAVWLLKSGRKLGKSSGYLSLAQSETLEPLSQQESLQFLQKLFTSDKKEGIIEVHGKKIIYRITGQKMEGLAAKEMKKVKNMANRIKKAGFEQALLHELSGRYPVKSFVKGF
jgi:ATP phosphoribosyltransferase